MSIKNIHRGSLKFLAFIGITLFVLLYIIGALIYPGGSDFHPQNNGFSISENYWCELLGENAKNGQKNNARTIGITALIILNSTLIILWFRISSLINSNLFIQITTIICGVLSALLSSFVFTHWHDLLIGCSVLLGLVAMLLTIPYLKSKYDYYLSLFNILMIALNGTIYFTDFGISYLPLIQKVTFTSVLIWFSILNLKID